MNKIVAFVTGGASGLGAATVSHLIKKGAAGCYVLDTQRYQNLEQFGNVHSFQGSVQDDDHVNQALEDCYQKFKKINLVVNCAGVSVAFKIFNFNVNQPQGKVDFEKVINVSYWFLSGCYVSVQLELNTKRFFSLSRPDQHHRHVQRVQTGLQVPGHER